MSKSRSIQADANKVSLILKTEMVESDFVILIKFGGDLKIQLRIKNTSCSLSQIGVKCLGVKIHANIVLVTSS